MTLASTLFAAGAFGYGIYNFPDAPIKQKGEVYTSKHGQPRTNEDYERFTLREKAVWDSFGSTFILAFVFTALEASEKRRRVLSK